MARRETIFEHLKRRLNPKLARARNRQLEAEESYLSRDRFVPSEAGSLYGDIFVQDDDHNVSAIDEEDEENHHLQP